MRTKRNIQGAVAAAVIAISLPATAGERYTVTAPVVAADPIISTRYEHTPREQCHQVYTRDRSHHTERRRDGDLASTLIGGLIGGAIGRQFGDGSGKKLLTVAGAFTGAAIANSNRARDIDHERPRQRCVVTHEREEIRVVDGWRVTYLFEGREFTRVMDERPGDRIELVVSVEPVARTQIADTDSRFM
ncbi:MAG: glycine zipper 2TM domain-containing protein [Gammaproteobacteria bacterium]|nr:glycine zipper 2TM domain-containing protein [Gammaproteobacteria bacterium]